MGQEPDLFYFLQCATVASPKEDEWPSRAKEEIYAVKKLVEYLDYVEKGKSARWFDIKPTGPNAKNWTGKVSSSGKDFGIEIVLKDSYPHTPPAARIPELMKYTDRKLDDSVLGLRLCDMHMEQNYWWNEHCSLALYLKREVSYWVQSIVFDIQHKGWWDSV